MREGASRFEFVVATTRSESVATAPPLVGKGMDGLAIDEKRHRDVQRR